MNSTFLTLIPNEVNPISFNYFRPISLCNASYKILTKMIASQLKPLMSKVIFYNQGGFTPNIQIMNNISLVQEALHSSNTSGEKEMVIKVLNTTNAFDRV